MPDPPRSPAEQRLEELIWTFPIVHISELGSRGSDRFHRLATLRFSTKYIANLGSEIPEYIIGRAFDSHLTSLSRREYVLLLGGIGGGNAVDALERLLQDTDPYVVAEAIRSLALRGEPLRTELFVDESAAAVKSALLFHEAMRGSGRQRGKYIEFVRSHLIEYHEGTDIGRQVFREIVSLVELKDVEALRVMVELLGQGYLLGTCSAELFSKVIVLPGRDEPWMDPQWMEEPKKAYEPLKKLLADPQLTAKWDSERGYLVVVMQAD
jgi:hypothetical protein